jgi:CubicO group peptidase (beta-lactamase class C family)
VLERRFFEVCEAAATRWEVPALAVGVLLGGETETFALGCTPETRFRVASITKPLVAQLALTLLDPDEPTAIWPDEVRVHHLLSHTSGFDGGLPLGDMARFGDGDDALAQCIEELPAIRRLVGLDEIWSYCNPGYWLTGYLAAERAESTFEEALSQHILRPAGLEATNFGEPDLPGTGRDISAVYPRARRPGGGLTSNVPDLLRFAPWHLAQPVTAQMRVVRAKPVGGVYGLGVFGERVAGVDVWGHTGGFGGFNSQLLMVPDREAVFVGLANHELAGKALREIEDEFFRMVVGEPRRRPPFVDVATDGFAGTYANTSSTWHVIDLGGELELGSGDDSFRARPIGETTFLVPDGRHVNERFDFPRPGFARIGSTLAERVA